MEVHAGIGQQWASLVTSVAAHRDAGAPGEDRARSEAETDRTGVALLTGFLGAGKSTILTRLLSDPGAVGVIRAVVNDVGRLPFDPTLVERRDAAMVELTNGCGCCVAGAAAEVGARLDEVAIGADLVVLEASGLADPAALAQVVEARPAFRLDRIVAVVDARAVDRLLGLSIAAPLLRRQLTVAEAVILSHTDDLTAEQAAETIDRVATLAPGSPVLPSTLAAPAHRALTPEVRIGASIASDLEPVAIEPVTLSFEPRRSIPGAVLAEVLGRHADRLLRAKGRLLVDGRHTLVQLTASGLTLTAGDPGPLGLTVVVTDTSPEADLARLFAGGGSGPSASRLDRPAPD